MASYIHHYDGFGGALERGLWLPAGSWEWQSAGPSLLYCYYYNYFSIRPSAMSRTVARAATKTPAVVAAAAAVGLIC